MKIIIGIHITFDLDEVKQKFTWQPCQRLKDCIKIDCWIEKKVDKNKFFLCKCGHEQEMNIDNINMESCKICKRIGNWSPT